MTARELDEDDVRIRPKRSSRPRTKDRPDYSQAALARIIAVDRGRSTALIEATGIVVTAMKARELGKKSVVVGDIVRIVGDTSGKVDTLARIVAVEPRRNELTRTVEDDAGMERMIVSNVDQLGIVLAAANPEPRHGFVDRALVVAFDQRITPIIIMTKCDLADPTEFLSAYKDLDVQSLQIQRGADLTAALRIIPRPLHGGVFHTYDDHRLATAGAMIGLRVPDIEVENIETTRKTLPDFPGAWNELLNGSR